MMIFLRYLLSFFIILGFCETVIQSAIAKNQTNILPDYEVLSLYEPPVMTRVHAADGSLMAEFATKHRLYLPIQSIPKILKEAFISAEDKNFYQHFGLDPEGLSRALINNIRNIGSGKRPEGASTITQQVAKNFLLSSEATLERKLKEAILAMRIEKTYSKDHILELYLNEIYLGRGTYGIAAASLTYFNKSVNELTLEQCAYLAALPKGPGNYDPFKNTQRAINRRNWVIDRMIANGYVTHEQGKEAKAKPLGVTIRGKDSYVFAADYFTEEVRRRLMHRYGAKTLYEGGLSIRTTLDPRLQLLARRALHNGLIKFDHSQGWRGAYEHIDIKNDWGIELANITGLNDVPEWRLAVVLSANANKVVIGLQPQREASGLLSKKRETAILSEVDSKWALNVVKENGHRRVVQNLSHVLQIGDVIFVEKIPNTNNIYRLQQIPKVEGAVIAMEPHTGRVLAMVGGFSFATSEFNRATQAYRQPGSAFKPFVYAAALDNGYTPASVVLDAPIEIRQYNGEIWQPKNYGGTFAGPSTLRYGIEYSRNLMTIRLAYDMGMPLVAEYAERFGIVDKLQPYLPMALGAGETTVLRMVTAYSIIANGGRSINPSLIDRIQDRYGKTIYRHDDRLCENCNAQSWNNQREPKLIDERDQVLDPMTAYQITSMMEGVIQRGTAVRLRYLNRHIAAKTGTTNDSKDVWFIGFTPDLVVGVFVGYDQPAPLGYNGTGSSLAAPIFGEFMEAALKRKPDVPFKMPEGMILMPINRRTGMLAERGEQDVIIEAFKPGTGPADIYQVIGSTNSFQEGVPIITTSPQVNKALESGTGGLY
ncbi:penicillin-binding protein 1A [Bartonella alsatica]|uniref:Penicillin-binding protein 1A n=2 Tax=Bartonella alsatica TaxID=52764 RepID=J0PTQ9_9HYPH|nr:penicillin-binding protein 1A [Bartonella alsatica]EJF75896.1 1A family penicillin-binding protein [Bartonella alsatica IBS 382]QLC51461.1 penicillin-binding protein 1A [Bartonella alsatica]